MIAHREDCLSIFSPADTSAQSKQNCFNYAVALLCIIYSYLTGTLFQITWNLQLYVLLVYVELNDLIKIISRLPCSYFGLHCHSAFNKFFQMPQDMCENDVSNISQKALRYHEQVEPESMLAESRKEDAPMINHELCEQQGQGELEALLETIIAEVELVPDCTIEPGHAEMQSKNTSVRPSESFSGLLSNGWVLSGQTSMSLFC